KELAVLHAVASPYRERSHFDAQNVLESGDARPHGSTSGWINRALTALPAGKAREAGVALGANVPLAMRGPAEVASWSPTKIDALESDAIANEAQTAADAESQDTAMAMTGTKPDSVVERDAKEKRNYNARY